MPKELEITLGDLEKVDNNLSVILRKDKLDNLINIMRGRYRSVRQFSKALNLSNGFVNEIVKGTRIKSFRLKFLRKMESILSTNLLFVVEQIVTRFKSNGFIPIEVFPLKSSPELASLVGHAFGDGHLSHTFMYANKSKELIKDVIDKSRKIGVRNVKISKRMNKGINVRFPRIIRNILIVAGAPIGRKTTQILNTPEWIKRGNFEIKKAFLQALFDDEGNVNSGEIRIQMYKHINLIKNHTNFFKELKNMLEEFGIKNVSIRDGYTFVCKDGTVTCSKSISFYGLSNMKIFREKIGFIHPDKINSVNQVIESIRNYWLRRYKSQIRIMELLKERGELNTTELSKEIGKTRRRTADNLRKLEKMDVISRIRVEDKTKPHIWFLKNPKNFKQF